MDLSARLRSLRNGSLSSSRTPATKTPQPASRSTSLPTACAGLEDETDPLRGNGDLNDKSLDELLADLRPDDQWKLNPDDPDDIQKLIHEAKEALPQDGPEPRASPKESGGDSTTGKSKGGKEYLTRDLDMSVFALDDEDGDVEDAKHSRLEDESREALDIVARMLDEVSLERQNEPPEDEESSSCPKQTRESVEEFSLPSAPSQLPEPEPLQTDTRPSKRSIDFESDIAARMAALKGLGAVNELGLPSAPTFKPIDKPVKGVMKKFTDEEVDSWCIICQDDATVKCMGCDGDLYCANCWKEGHMGPDVGWEEKRHKWTKFRKPN